MRYIAKWLSQLLLVLSALLVGEWSLFNLFSLVGSDGQVHIGFISGPKAQVELKVRLLVVVFAVILNTAAEIIDVYLPRKELREFRAEYLNAQCETWRDEIFKKIPGIRVNALYVRRRWYWPFWRVFDWAWSNGFEPPHGHLDANMPLACWQGISGQALKTKVAKSVFFVSAAAPPSFRESWLLGNSFRFTNFQIERTRNITGIISIPMLRKGRAASPSYKAIGVFTIDACTPAASQFLIQNEVALVEYFFRIGKLLGSLDM
jgi:hypothetical protein